MRSLFSGSVFFIIYSKREDQSFFIWEYYFTNNRQK